MAHGDMNNAGQNLYMSYPPPSGGAAADSWYSEIEDYDFNSGRSKTGKAVGHFTQLVWAGSTHVGVGRSSDGQWVCANYRPAGNFIGEERANVFPANGSAPPRDDPTPQRDNRMTEESPDEPLHPDLEGDLMRVMQSRGGGGGPGRGWTTTSFSSGGDFGEGDPFGDGGFGGGGFGGGGFGGGGFGGGGFGGGDPWGDSGFGGGGFGGGGFGGGGGGTSTSTSTSTQIINGRRVTKKVTKVTDANGNTTVTEEIIQ